MDVFVIFALCLHLITTQSRADDVGDAHSAALTCWLVFHHTHKKTEDTTGLQIEKEAGAPLEQYEWIP